MIESESKLQHSGCDCCRDANFLFLRWLSQPGYCSFIYCIEWDKLFGMELGVVLTEVETTASGTMIMMLKLLSSAILL